MEGLLENMKEGGTLGNQYYKGWGFKRQNMDLLEPEMHDLTGKTTFFKCKHYFFDTSSARSVFLFLTFAESYV